MKTIPQARSLDRQSALASSVVALAAQIAEIDRLRVRHQPGGTACSCGRPHPCPAPQRLTGLRALAAEALAAANATLGLGSLAVMDGNKGTSPAGFAACRDDGGPRGSTP